MTANVKISQILLKRGNTAAASSYTGPLGEVVIDTGLNTLRIQDGVTAGGHIVQGTGGGGNVDLSPYSTVTQLAANVTLLTNKITGANTAIIAANTAMKAYVDTQIAGTNVDLSPYATSANLVSANTAMKAYVDTQIAGTNVDLSPYATSANLVSANTAMKSYVDAQVSTKTTTGYVDNAISVAINGLVGSAPGTLDTLNEIAANLASEASAIGSITNSIASVNANVAALQASIVGTGNFRFNGATAYAAGGTNLWITPDNQRHNMIQLPGPGNESLYPLTLNSNDGDIYLTSNNKSWKFNTNGYLEFPDSTVQATAFGGTGDIRFAENKIFNNDGENGAVFIGTNQYSSETWAFFPSINNASTQALELRNMVGNVVIGTTSSASWRFTAEDQSLSIPNGWGGSGTASLSAPNAVVTLKGSNGAVLQYVSEEPVVNAGVTNWSTVFANQDGVALEVVSGNGEDPVGTTQRFTFDNNGNLTLPTNLDFSGSPIVSSSGIVFGDNTFQRTAYTGIAAAANVILSDNRQYSVVVSDYGSVNIPGNLTIGGNAVTMVNGSVLMQSEGSAVQAAKAEVDAFTGWQEQFGILDVYTLTGAPNGVTSFMDIVFATSNDVYSWQEFLVNAWAVQNDPEVTELLVAPAMSMALYNQLTGLFEVMYARYQDYETSLKSIDLVTGSSVYTFGQNGNITFPDGSLQNTAFTKHVELNGGTLNFSASPAGVMNGITSADSSVQTTAWLGNINTATGYINFTSSAVGHDQPVGSITTSGTINTSSNVIAGGVYTNNYRWANGAPFVSTTTGAVTFNNNQIQGNPIGATGTIYSFAQDNSGSSWSSGGGTTGFISFPQYSQASLVQAGWVMRWADGSTHTVNSVYQPLGTYWVMTFNGTTWTGGGVFPLTVQSPDYFAGSAPLLQLAPNASATSTAWTFYANGNVRFPDGSTQSTAYVGSTYGNANVSAYLPTYSGSVGALTATGDFNRSYATNSQGLVQMGDGVNTNYIVSVGSGANTWGGAGSLNLLTYSNTPIVFFQNQLEAGRITSGQVWNISKLKLGATGLTFNDNSVQTSAFGNTNVAAYLAGNVTTGNVQIGSALQIHGLDNSIGSTNGSAVAFRNRVNINGSGVGVGLYVAGNVSTGESITIGGNLTISGVSAGYGPNRPAFRVTGTGGPINATANVTSSNFTVDYNQGNYLNASTGYFTAPVPGLYSVHLVVRTNTNNLNNITQAVVQHNTSVGNSVACMVEFAQNTSMNHAGVSTIVRMAVGDTLQMRVLQGAISFDGNDNWSVAYIG